MLTIFHRFSLAAALVAYSAIALPVLFWNLGGGEFEVYDEGLYGHLARNPIEKASYLYAVDEDGNFSGKYSKPPLAILAVRASFAIWGPSVFAVRAPFAASVWALGLILVLWGARLRGPGLGFLWGVILATGGASLHWGRTACIEPLFVCACTAALWTYAEALDRERRWPWLALAGFALSAAFFTKQAVVVLATAPIVVLEIFRLRREGWRPVLARLVAALSIPALAGTAWLTIVYINVGHKLFEVFFAFSLGKRLSGFGGITHFRSLNRIAHHLEINSWPFGWELMGLGLGLFAVSHWRREKVAAALPGGAWLIAAMPLPGVLVYENISQSMLPWYAYWFVPALALGAAWPLTAAGEKIWRWWQSECSSKIHADAAGRAATWLGGVLIVQAVSLVSQDTWSRLNLLAAGLVGAIIAMTLIPENRQRAARWLFFSGVGIALGGTVFAYARQDIFHSAPPRFDKMMRSLADHRGPVLVSKRLKLDAYQLGTFFGPRAEKTSRVPWETKAAGRGRVAYVMDAILPSPLAAPAGEVWIRDLGATALIGPLRENPASPGALSRWLGEGPLVIEAEWMATEYPRGLRAYPEASGGEAYAVVPWRNHFPGKMILARGRSVTLPPGEYAAGYWVRAPCHGFRYEVAEAHVKVGGKVQEKVVKCRTGEGPGFRRGRLAFTLEKAAVVEFEFEYLRGEFWLDRMEIWWAEKFPAGVTKTQ